MARRTEDYVKFIRGSKEAFNLLNNKDSNTLYFISEKDSTTGSLYLGSKLISGESTGISELGNIVIKNIGDSQILYYDYESEAWVNGSIYDLIGTMKGATADTDSTIGLVPVAKAGQQNLFFRGDGIWAVPEFEVKEVKFDANIFTNNETEEVSLIDFKDAVVGSLLTKGENGSVKWTSKENLLSAVNGEITSLKEQISKFEGGITRTIVGSLDDIKPEEGKSDNFIYMVSNNGAGNNLYDEYMVINGNIEQIGANLSGNITGYVKEEVFNTAVGALEESISTLNTKMSGFETAVSNLGSSFNELDTKVSELETTISNLNTNFVTAEKYAAEVGNLNAVIEKWEKDTIVEQVDLLTNKTAELTDMLTWYELEL